MGAGRVDLLINPAVARLSGILDYLWPVGIAPRLSRQGGCVRPPRSRRRELVNGPDVEPLISARPSHSTYDRRCIAAAGRAIDMAGMGGVCDAGPKPS